MIFDRTSKVSVLVADDHELTRLSLKLLFANQQDIDLIGLASNGQEAVELAQQYLPDVAILDLQMPVMNGLSAASQIKLVSPDTKIVAYTSIEDPQTEVMIQTAPIDTWCKKDTSTEALIDTVKQLGWRSLSYR